MRSCSNMPLSHNGASRLLGFGSGAARRRAGVNAAGNSRSRKRKGLEVVQFRVGPEVEGELGGVHLAERDGDPLGGDGGDAVLGDVCAVAVEHEDGAQGERDGDRSGELAWGDHPELPAEEDVALGEEGDGAEGAGEVVVVDVRRDAVPDVVDVDDAAVGDAGRREDAPGDEAADHRLERRRQRVDVLAADDPGGVAVAVGGVVVAAAELDGGAALAAHPLAGLRVRAL